MMQIEVTTRVKFKHIQIRKIICLNNASETQAIEIRLHLFGKGNMNLVKLTGNKCLLKIHLKILSSEEECCGSYCDVYC